MGVFNLTIWTTLFRVGMSIAITNISSEELLKTDITTSKTKHTYQQKLTYKARVHISIHIYKHAAQKFLKHLTSSTHTD